MAGEEGAHVGAVGQAQETAPRIAQGHDEAHQLALGPADGDPPEIDPVDLGLLGREEAEPHRCLGLLLRPQSEVAQEVAEVVQPAGVAPLPDLLVENPGGKARFLLQLFLDERDVGVDHLRPRTARHTGAVERACHRAVMDAEMSRDGSDGPAFGPVQAQDLAAGLLIDCHGTVTPFAVSRAVAMRLRAPGPCRPVRIVSTGAPNHGAMVVSTR